MSEDLKLKFLTDVIINLVKSGSYHLMTRNYDIKLGLVYEFGNKYIVPHYELTEGCTLLKVTQYDSNFKLTKEDEFYSDDDCADFLDTFLKLKESEINREIQKSFEDAIDFIKSKKKIVN